MNRVIMLLCAILTVGCSEKQQSSPDSTTELTAMLDEQGHTLLSMYRSMDGSTTARYIAKDHLQTGPIWDGISDPPLSIGDAVRQARLTLDSGSVLDLVSISIRPAMQKSSGKMWYYEVQLQERHGEDIWGITHTIYMSIDGRVIDTQTITVK